MPKEAVANLELKVEDITATNKQEVKARPISIVRWVALLILPNTCRSFFIEVKQCCNLSCNVHNWRIVQPSYARKFCCGFRRHTIQLHFSQTTLLPKIVKTILILLKKQIMTTIFFDRARFQMLLCSQPPCGPSPIGARVFRIPSAILLLYSSMSKTTNI